MGTNPGAESTSMAGVPYCSGYHSVQFYESDKLFIEQVAATIASRLSAGESVITIVSAPHRDALAKVLEERGVDVSSTAKPGRYACLDADETVSKVVIQGWPDSARFRSTLGGVIERARAAAGNPESPVFVFSEMVTLLCEKGRGEAAIRLEQLWNELALSHAFEIHCAYALRAFAGPAEEPLFQRLCAEHSTVIPAESYTLLANERDRGRAISFLQQQACELKSIAAQKDQLARALFVELNELRRLHQISRLIGRQRPEEVLLEVLTALSGLHRTNIGLACFVDSSQGGGLRLAATMGFAPETPKLIERIAEVTCGGCVANRARIVIDDTEADAAFQYSRDVSRAAGFRAVHSVPLVSRNGNVAAVVSVLFRQRRKLTESEIQRTDLYAALAAAAIEYASPQQQYRPELVPLKLEKPHAPEELQSGLAKAANG